MGVGMSRDTIRYLIVVALLAVAGVGAFVLSGPAGERGPAGEPGRVFVTDVDYWRKTNRQRTVRTPYDFTLGPNLAAIPLEVGEWRGVDVPEDNQEVYILLEPEVYILRRYTRPDGRYLWLHLIGSHKTKSFHSPQLCYSALEWQTSVGSEAIPIGPAEVYALKVVARRPPQQHIVLYFFLWPNARRETTTDGLVMFRVTAPLQGTEEETMAMEREFIRQFFTAAVDDSDGLGG